MSAQPVCIGTRVYATKSAALDAIRCIRNEVYARTYTLPWEDSYLRDLIELHPDAEEKIGSGIDYFEARQNIGGTIGFWIVRVDGSETDFSFIRCLTPASHDVRVRIAMRREVRDQIAEYRSEFFSLDTDQRCPITNDRLTPQTSHVDHYSPTFLNLAHAFAISIGGYPLIAVVAGDSVYGARFAFEGAAKVWRDYHLEKAQLRVVSRRANLSILRRGEKRERKDGAA